MPPAADGFMDDPFPFDAPTDEPGGGGGLYRYAEPVEPGFDVFDGWYRNPRALAFRGVVAVLFGLATLVWPGLTLTALVLLWGAYVLVEGVSTLVALATRAPGTQQHRVYLIVHGLAGIGAGVVTLVWPGITALALLFVIAAWTLFVGVSEIVSAVRFREAIRHHWLLGLSGVLSLFVGLALIAAPVAGALAITWLIGWWAVALGAFSLSTAWHLRGRRTRRHAASARRTLRTT